jgi:RimJ/RimL family protein N-acetyltransferase
MRYFKKISGERIYLSPINTGDVETYTKWLNDFEVSGNLGNFRQLISLNAEQKALEGMAGKGQHYSIVLQDGDVMIGGVSFNETDHISRKAEIGLFIGEAEYRNKGYGAEALRLMLDFGFQTLNLHNVMLLVHSDNERAMACYKKVGFREFGRRREAKYKNGRYIDVIYMDLLDTEFYG